MNTTETRRRWPRLTLVLPPPSYQALVELATRNYRGRHDEALRLLLDGIERERSQPAKAAR